MASLEDCCNPSARQERDRCPGCPMRKRVSQKAEPQKDETQPHAEPEPKLTRSALWRELHEEFTGEK